VARTQDFPDGVVDILLHHHERFRRSRLPLKGMREGNPPRGPDRRGGGRLRRHDRGPTLRPGVRREEALRVMAVMRGGAFDPEVVDALFGVLKG